MATQVQTPTRTNHAQAPSPSPVQQLAPSQERTIEYTPLGAKDKIKLSVAIVLRDLVKPTKSGKLPSEADAMKFLMLCRARELNPWEGDAFLVGFDGNSGPEFSLITAHQAFGKRAEVNPNYDGMESGVIVQNGDQVIDREGDFIFDGEILLGGWATVYVKNRRIPTRKRLKFSARSKDNSFWKKDPAGMIVKCSEVDALRSTFPTTLGGLYLEAERHLVEVVEAEPVTPPVGRNRVARQSVQVQTPISVQADPEDSELASKDQLDLINFTMGDRRITAEALAAILEAEKIPSLTQATAEQAARLLAVLEEVPAAQ